MVSWSLSWNHYEFIIFVVKSFWINFYFCEFIAFFAIYHLEFAWIHCLSLEFTSNLISFSRIHFKFTIIFANLLRIHYFFANSISIHFLFREFTSNSLFFREFNFNSLSFSRINFQFTFFSRIHLRFTIFFANSISIHRLSLKFTSNLISLARIHFKFTVISRIHSEFNIFS